MNGKGTLLSAIVAMARNRVIGRTVNGKQTLPWHLPEDLKHFKATTWGHPVIMGRKTFDSVGKPLPGRENWVITRQDGFQAPGAHVVTSLEAAIEGARHAQVGSEEIFIVGGSEIYRLALPYLQRVYMTLIDADVEGDVFFPEEFSFSDFECVKSETRHEKFQYSIMTLDKR